MAKRNQGKIIALSNMKGLTLDFCLFLNGDTVYSSSSNLIQCFIFYVILITFQQMCIFIIQVDVNHRWFSASSVLK